MCVYMGAYVYILIQSVTEALLSNVTICTCIHILLTVYMHIISMKREHEFEREQEFYYGSWRRKGKNYEYTIISKLEKKINDLSTS